MEKLILVMPAYNEEANIRQVVADWLPAVEATGPDSRMVVLDDGSKDGTYAILQELAAAHPALVAVTKPNGGHGATVLYGYRYALAHGADYVFQTDSDGQTLPSEFPAFWERRAEAAMVIGHRKGRQDGASRILVTKVLKFVLWLSFGVRVTDANTPFRLMEAKQLGELLPKVPDDFNLSNVLLSVLYVKKKLPVIWMPVTFRPRQGGVNSINFKKIIGIGKKAWKDFHRLRRSVREA